MDGRHLSVSAHPLGFGPCFSADPAVQSELLPPAIPLSDRRGPDGVYQLHHAFGDLHVVLLRLRIELLWRAAILSNLLCCLRYLDTAIDHQPDLAALFP